MSDEKQPVLNLRCTTTPFLSILCSDGEYERFQGGFLEIGPDNPHYDAVRAEAQRNPSITILVNATTCPECGEVFTGQMAKAELAKHRKRDHFAEWQADQDAAAAVLREKTLKARASVFCDVCQPIQEFPDAEALAEHVKLLHTSAPPMDESGNTIGGGDDEGRRPGERPIEIPAATPTT